ncbi:MAG TPA: permease-like cell division protein FtsX [Gammaproteobacteria bacterium]|nr:permease-like cell division protein FtsX [Gammaproteobacteria bacterium]
MEALRHYFRLHRNNCVDAVARIIRQPFASSLTILVIAIALALPAGLRVAVNNADAVSESWQGAADFTVYLKLDVTTDAARRTARTIEARDDVAAVALVDRDAALAEFRAKSGFGEALDALDANPLPHALVVRPESGVAADVEALASAIGKLPEADVVQVDTAWVARLRAMLALAGRLVDFATVVLGLAVTIVVGNTIRLEINSRSVEIEVTKLVGGTDGFIRRPFLYLGFCYGLAGALVAALVVALGLLLLDAPVRAVAALYGSGFALRGLSLIETGVLLAGGALLGWAGAGLAAARHLRAIEPK